MATALAKFFGKALGWISRVVLDVRRFSGMNGEWHVIGGGDSRRMNFEIIAGERIYRPRTVSEVNLRNRAEMYLRSKYQPGEYRGRDQVNEILQHHLAFFGGLLTPVLEKLASLEFIEFVLAEYDVSGRIVWKVRKLAADHPDQVRWAEFGPIFRRTAKFLAERLVLLAPNDEVPRAPEHELLDALDEAWICTEEIVRYYMLSDQTYSLLPDDTLLTIAAPGVSAYFDLSITKPEFEGIQSRVREDTRNRGIYILNDQFLFDVAKHEEFLGPPLKATIGIGYEEALGVRLRLIEGAQPVPGGLPIPFVHRQNAINQLASDLGVPADSVAAALDGFTLTKAKMENENRVVWRPKQENRAYRRAFFEFPHPSGPQLIWSKEMAIESRRKLVSEVVFKKIPREWESKGVKRAVEQVSNAGGKWFESVCIANLGRLGFGGTKSYKNGIGLGAVRLPIPRDVGELDCLGYSQGQELLLVAECKLVRSGSEPAFFRDDISKFVASSSSYADQLRQKAEWVRNNCDAVCRAMESEKGNPAAIRPRRIAHVVTTFFPSIVTHMIQDFPCVSITELMTAHEAARAWPYRVGICDLP